MMIKMHFVEERKGLVQYKIHVPDLRVIQRIKICITK